MPVSAEEFIERCDALMCDQTPVEVLYKTRELLSDPDRWVQFVLASDENGYRTKPSDPDAVRWGLEGAVGKVSNPYGIVPPCVLKILDMAVLELYNQDVNCGYFNDNNDHQQVMNLIDGAISLEIIKGEHDAV